MKLINCIDTVMGENIIRQDYFKPEIDQLLFYQRRIYLCELI